MKSFYTAVNCMDGRVQLPVNTYLREHLGVEYIDTVTEAGPVRILAEAAGERRGHGVVKSILKRIDISLGLHGSQGIAVVAHYDCAGNPLARAEQLQQLKKALAFLRSQYPDTPLMGLWVNKDWEVEKIDAG